MASVLSNPLRYVSGDTLQSIGSFCLLDAAKSLRETYCRHCIISYSTNTTEQIMNNNIRRVSHLKCFFFVPRKLNAQKILRSAHTVYLCVLCGSQSKQRFFPIQRCVCMVPGTHTAAKHRLRTRKISRVISVEHVQHSLMMDRKRSETCRSDF